MKVEVKAMKIEVQAMIIVVKVMIQIEVKVMIIEIEVMTIEIKVMIVEIKVMIIEGVEEVGEEVSIQIEIDLEAGINLLEGQNIIGIGMVAQIEGKDHHQHRLRKNPSCQALEQLCQGQVVIPVLTTL